jgi:hypothetical protein
MAQLIPHTRTLLRRSSHHVSSPGRRCAGGAGSPRCSLVQKQQRAPGSTRKQAAERTLVHAAGEESLPLAPPSSGRAGLLPQAKQLTQLERLGDKAIKVRLRLLRDDRRGGGSAARARMGADDEVARHAPPNPVAAPHTRPQQTLPLSAQGPYLAYARALETRPLATKALTSFVGFVIGDLLAQSTSPGAWHALRTLRLGLYGLLIDGPVGAKW